MRKAIPNLITFSGLFCGFIGLMNVIQGSLEIAAYAIMAAAFLDLFDGFAARLLKASSSIGAQLDSLCDLVNFGVLPALIAVSLFHRFGASESWFTHYYTGSAYTHALPIFVYLAGAVWRLARFNVVDEKGFSGLPSPAAALFMAGFPLVYVNGFSTLPIPYEVAETIYANGLSVLISSIAIGILMVVPIPMMSFKSLKPNIKSLLFPVLLLVFAITLFTLYGFFALQPVIIFYVIASLLQKLLFHEVQS